MNLARKFNHYPRAKGRGKEVGKKLTPRERLRLLRNILDGQRFGNWGSLDVKNLKEQTTYPLSGGKEFDAIDIHVESKPDKSKFSIVVWLRHGGEWLPKSLHCWVTQAGVLTSITVATIESPEKFMLSDHVPIVLEGTLKSLFSSEGDKQTIYSIDRPDLLEASAAAAVQSFDDLLQLAALAQKSTLSRN
jgi:hypothetical protein